MANEVDENDKDEQFPKYCFEVYKDKILCVPSNIVCCFRAELLEARPSAFHTDQLAEATQAINKIIAEVNSESENQHLAFIQTSMGVMLTWVTPEAKAVWDSDHDEVPVTAADDRDTLAKALKLKTEHFATE